MTEKEFGRSFQHYENYYEASKHATNPEHFHYAIARFFYEDIEPEFEAEMDKFLWKMIRPSIAKSKRQSERGGGAPVGSHNNPNGRRGKGREQESSSEQAERKEQAQSDMAPKPEVPKRTAKAFVPPTVKDVEEYATNRGFLDPSGFALHFFTYYTEGEQKWHLSNGKPMRDWKKAVITWEPNNKYKMFSVPASETLPAAYRERKPDYLDA